MSSSSSSTLLQDLETALESVLILEDIYSSKLKKHDSSSTFNNNNNTNSLENILRMGTNHSKNFSQIENTRVFGHMIGGSSVNGGLEALLKGGTGIRKVHSVPATNSFGNGNGNNNQNMTALLNQQQLEANERAQQQEASEKRKTEAKTHWFNLDQRLLKLSRQQSKISSDVLAPQPSTSTASTQKSQQQILADVGGGRPDRWVRMASVAERETLKDEVGDALNTIAMMKEEKGKMQKSKVDDGHSTTTDDDFEFLKHQQRQSHDVVLGSASSSISRAILHSLMLTE